MSYAYYFGNTKQRPKKKSVKLKCGWYFTEEKDRTKYDPEPALFATLTTFGRPDDYEDDEESERHQCIATECLTVKTATAVSRHFFTNIKQKIPLKK